MVVVVLLVVLGFFEQDFRGEERANPHALTIGILSGPPLASNSFGSLEVSFSIGFGPNSASKFYKSSSSAANYLFESTIPLHYCHY